MILHIKRQYILFMISLLMIASLFTVPYLFPSKKISIGSSFDYGFNNKIGLLLLIIYVVCFIVLGYLKCKTNKTYNFQKKPNVISKKLFLYTTIISVLCLCCISFFVRKSYGLLESSYFISHLYDMKIGLRPHIDFEFCYGYLMLEIPYLLFCCFKGILTIQESYYIFLIINHILGLFFLRFILEYMELQKKETNYIFILISIFGFPYHLGLNYTLCRFLLPIFLFLNIQKYANLDKFFYLLVLNIAFILISLNYSPEFGICFIFTLIVYYTCRFFIEKNIKWMFLDFIVLLSIIVSYKLNPNSLLMVQAFASGALNWPFIICLILVIFFYAIFILGINIGQQLRNIKCNLNILSFELLSCSFIPAALGRCDPGHIIYNGMFIFLLVLSFLPNTKLRIAYKILLFVSYILYFPYVFYTNFYGYTSAIIETIDIDSVSYKMLNFGFNLIGKEAKFNTFLEQRNAYFEISKYFEKYSVLEAPYNINSSIYIPLKQKNIIPNLYYTNVGISGGEKAFEINLEQLKSRKAKYLIIPENYKNFSKPSSNRFLINILFSTYYRRPLINNGNILYKRFEEYIEQNYSQIDKYYGLLIMETKD